jgi:hypothetical protein
MSSVAFSGACDIIQVYNLDNSDLRTVHRHMQLRCLEHRLWTCRRVYVQVCTILIQYIGLRLIS